MELSKQIKNCREQQGLSQDELAKKLGYKDRSTIAKIEAGVNDLTQSKIIAFAKALNTTPHFLMGWEEPPPAAQLEEIASPYHPRSIPILGCIAAGQPLYAEENIEGYTSIDLGGGHEYFALRVRGDSMNAANINHGDTIIVRKQSIVENGDIAVVLVDGENATVKQFYQVGDTVTLIPKSQNPEHQIQVYPIDKIPVTVIGKVVQSQIQFE